MKKTLSLVLWVAGLQLMSSGMGMITKANLAPWYLSLHKSSLTPPGFVFGIVWTILYVMLGVVGWKLFQSHSLNRLKQLRVMFITQLILNGLWTPLFFHFHWVGAALVCLMSIVLLTTGFLMIAWREARPLFWLVLPYWLWGVFASYLNFITWQAGL